MATNTPGHARLTVGLIISLMILSAPAQAELALNKNKTLFAYGDGRLRFEKDWDSYRGDDTQRSDRSRLRIRARLGLRWQPTEWLKFESRARTGNDDHQQSGHVTVLDFNGNEKGASDLNLDKWFAQVKWDGLSVWAGRNSLPWWRQNELFWDEDVTPRGAGLIYVTNVGAGKLTWNSGIYDFPAGLRDYTGDGWSAQLVYAQDNDAYGLTLAGGVIDINADAQPGDYATRTLLQGNARRDYQLGMLQMQWRFNNLPAPFYIGAELIYNNQNYSASDADPFTAFHSDDTGAWIVQAVYGGTQERWDWLAGAYYAHIEALALHNSYAQDDWVRWGSPDQTASSNFKGPEFRGGLGLGNNMNIIARLFLVRAVNKELPTDQRNQTGKRFRVDLNISF